MKIVEIKKLKNQYKIKFFMENDFVSLLFFEEVLIEFNIFKPQEISFETYNEMILLNQFYLGFYKSIKYLKNYHTKQELISYLEKNDLYSESLIEKLENLNLINDSKYKEKYVNELKNKKKGKVYIENKLKEKNLDTNISYIEELDNAKEVLNKYFLIHKKDLISINMLKDKSIKKLLELGYSNDVIEKVISEFDFSIDELKNLKETYKKIDKNKMDKTKIISFLLRKGYKYSDVKNILGGDIND